MDIRELAGTWHIVCSTFPLWLKDDKTQPTLNYEPAGTPGLLLDTVRYVQRGRTKTIKGIDRYDAEGDFFVWSGFGLLALLRSEWKVLELDAAKGYMIIGFKKTLVTPEGFDIATKDPAPDGAFVSDLLDRFREKYGEQGLRIVPGVVAEIV